MSSNSAFKITKPKVQWSGTLASKSKIGSDDGVLGNRSGGGADSNDTELFTPAEFQENIAWFLDDSPGESCATAGKAAYRCANHQ